MPSSKDPTTVVNPGPGKIPSGTVTTSSLLFSSGGGSGASLAAHISDPIDAHMASAIGINPTYPTTGQSVLSSVGGTVDGESVLDFIFAMKDLMPERPDQVGFNNTSIPNTGLPVWGIPSPVGGGFPRGVNSTPTRWVVEDVTSSFTPYGMVYPADRGVLAVYKNVTNGNYFDAANTTLVAALWLGNSPSPSGIPDANFNETLRVGLQTDYIDTNAGLDRISLYYRLPFLKDYTPYVGAPYSVFSANFYRYQLAFYQLRAQSISLGDSGSYLIVHWKETYATSLALIQPANLTLGNLVAANCYSATPSGGDFDTGNALQVNRHNVYRDTNSSITPALASFTAAENGIPTTVNLSGVAHYTGNLLTWSVDVRVNDLFKDTFFLGPDNPPHVPTGFGTTSPVVVDWVNFGGTDLNLGYYNLRPTGGALYTITNSPQPVDQGQYLNASIAINAPTNFTNQGFGYGSLKIKSSKPFQLNIDMVDPNKSWLYNSYPQTGGSTTSTDTFEPFNDEKYRYISNYFGVATNPPMLPSGGDDYNSNTVILTGTNDLQVIGSVLTYPQVDYSAASFRPVGQPNYAAVLAADAGSHNRKYARLFDTGVARNTGRIRIKGISASDFASTNPFTGNELTDHPGGIFIVIQVPGLTDFLDIGRPKGDPILSYSLSFAGCQTNIITSGPDVYVSYDTTLYTSDNGSGNYPLIVLIGYFKGVGVGSTAKIDELEWLPPV